MAHIKHNKPQPALDVICSYKKTASPTAENNTAHTVSCNGCSNLHNLVNFTLLSKIFFFSVLIK